jgi:hypothetical protein
MITTSGNSHHWRLLMWPDCGKVYRWRLVYVAHQWWLHLYIHETRSRKFSKSSANTKRRRQAAKFSCGAPPSSPTAAAPPTTPPSSRSARPTSTSTPPSSARAPPSSAVAPPPLLPWTAAAPLSAVAPLPRRPSTTAPLPYQDGVLLPADCFPNCWPGPAGDCSAASASADSAAPASAESAAPARHRQLISSPLGTHGGRG